MLDESFLLSNCPEYAPILQYVIDFFLQEKERNRSYLMNDVDESVGFIFQINPTYASKFRKLFFYDNKQYSPTLYDECMNRIRIRHFSYIAMEKACKEHEILVPKETRDELLFLQTLALPVSEMWNEKSEFEIHADFKCAAKKWISEIDIIMEDVPNLKAAIYMYLHQFRENELIWWLLATLSSIDKEKIEKWIHAFGDIPSEKSILEIVEVTDRWFFLLDFKNKLPRLNAKNLKHVFENVTGFDLYCAYNHINYFKQFSRTPLRQIDIYLTYLIIATLSQQPMELMLEQIAAASNADLPVKICPKNEIYVDWNTHTAW